MNFGATDTINAKNQDVLSAIMDITNDRGIDYVNETAGRREAVENTLRPVRDHGNLCIIACNLP